MPYIKVNINKLCSFSDDVNSIYSRINRIKSEFISIGNSLDWDVKSASNIRRKIQTIENGLRCETAGLKKMRSFLISAADNYNKTENENSEIRRVNTDKEFSIAKAVHIQKKQIKKMKMLDLVVDNAGFCGGIISSIGEFFEFKDQSEISYGALAKGSKSFVNTVFDIWQNNKKLKKLSRMNPGQAVKTGLKRFVGLDKAFVGNLKPSTATKFSTRFYNNFQKQMLEKQEAFTTKGAKSVFSWAGVAVSAIANAIDNIKEGEEKGSSTIRVAAEIVTETAVDTGLNIVVGAAVSAGIAALGFTSAPVLAVGAATGLVLAGANSLCKWVTGKVAKESKGLTETISDAILDVGEAKIKGRMKMASDMNNFFKKVF